MDGGRGDEDQREVGLLHPVDDPLEPVFAALNPARQLLARREVDLQEVAEELLEHIPQRLGDPRVLVREADEDASGHW